MIYTVLLRPDIDKALASKVSLWLHKHQKATPTGKKYAEFYVWGDDAHS